MSTKNKEVAVVAENAVSTMDTFNQDLPSFSGAVVSKIPDSSSYLSTADMVAGGGFFCCIKAIGLGDVPNKQKPIIGEGGEIEGYKVEKKPCVFLIQVNPETGAQNLVHTASPILRNEISSGVNDGRYLTYEHGKNATPLWVQFNGMKSSGAKQIGLWSVHRVALNGDIVA